MSSQNLRTDDTAANRDFTDRWRIDCDFVIKQPIQCTWLAPSGYDIIINTDGSKQDVTARFGALVRDSLGDPLVVSYGGSLLLYVITHELQRVYLGLKLAIRIEARYIHLCTDSLIVCLLLNSLDPKPPWGNNQIRRRLQILLNKTFFMKIIHCYKESNKTADFLTKLHPKKTFVNLVIEDFSPDFREILASD
ncbi:uncharacterized protein LOC113295416 [Papaver somniferum]|uniref:uncharacterized protein LOC113295416 n=1 Tax=Papaver somniferum TaxID=3469 RepID=UPI000E6FFA45|nr:uncharacterized protein LOC113295416 [Papaver somniferum]